MSDDVSSMIERPREMACIRLDANHRDSYRVGRLLEAVGGHPVAPRGTAIYRFLTGIARDEALGLVQGRFGRTVATAFDRRPWPTR